MISHQELPGNLRSMIATQCMSTENCGDLSRQNVERHVLVFSQNHFAFSMILL